MEIWSVRGDLCDKRLGLVISLNSTYVVYKSSMLNGLSVVSESFYNVFGFTSVHHSGVIISDPQ